jgi:co-chaperonin GroES (HSP10)
MQESVKLKKGVEAEDKSQLPNPMGWRILVAMPEPEEKTEGGIVKAKQTIDLEEVANICGYVLKMGEDCYQDKERYPNGPWCKAGDWVVFRAYSGTRLKIYGKEFRIINDDTVEAVVEDPRGVVRV